MLIVIEILLTLFLMNLNYPTWLIGNYYKLLILIVETVEPHNMNQPVEGSQYCIKEGWPIILPGEHHFARGSDDRCATCGSRKVVTKLFEGNTSNKQSTGSTGSATCRFVRQFGKPQAPYLVMIWGYLDIFGAYFGQFPSVSGFHRVAILVAISCHQGHATRRESGFRAQRSPLLNGRCALTAQAPEGLLRWRVLWLGGRKQILGTRKFLGDALE